LPPTEAAQQGRAGCRIRDKTEGFKQTGNGPKQAREPRRRRNRGFLQTPPHARFQLTAAKAEDGVFLSIADSGPGIPAGKHKVILERFAWLDTAEGAPGFGLGFSFAADWHGARLVSSGNMPARGRLSEPQKKAESFLCRRRSDFERLDPALHSQIWPEPDAP
jgi:hypothetical protein